MLSSVSGKPRVAIIGAGFGGCSAARALRGADVDIEIIDRRNYHLFQPLLYQVATADLSPADIAWPIRGMFASQKNVSVVLSEVLDVELDEKRVVCRDTVVPYDYLVVATGSNHSYFGNDQWSDNAPGLKKIVDATDIRRRVLIAFERAELASTREEQLRQLTFVVVGGGPTGVEMAGAIAELAKVSLVSDFRRIKPGDARVLLVEANERVLRAFPEDLSAKAQEALAKLGVEIHLNTRVQDISDQGVAAGDMYVPAATVIWGAGVKVEHLDQWLDVETDRVGRVRVEPDLSLRDHPEVFVVGDAARANWGDDGSTVPGIAPAAKQGGKFVGKLIAERVAGRHVDRAFKYKHLGNLATIGRHAAVIDFGWLKMSGAIAWWLWGLAHIYFLIGVRKPIFVAMSWFYSYLSHAKGARLITGTASAVSREQAEPLPAPAEVQKAAS